jgi:hypothetical protein
LNLLPKFLRFTVATFGQNRGTTCSEDDLPTMLNGFTKCMGYLALGTILGLIRTDGSEMAGERDIV